MFLKKIVFSALAFFLFFSTNAQNKALDFINTSDLKRHLSVIASDSLMGRQIGADNNGLDMAAEYIINSIQNIGLSPVDGNYSQPVSIYRTKTDAENSYLQAFNKKNKSVLKTDSIVCLSGYGSINIEKSEIVFAGFGINESINLQDKMVMMFVGDEASYKRKKLAWNEGSENRKINDALEKGARGVILVNPTFDVESDLFAYVKQRMNQQRFSLKHSTIQGNSNNSILITASVADLLLGGEGQIENWLNDNTNHIKTNIKIDVQCDIVDHKIPTRNIFGIVEGSDPKLKDECVVLMAHYDHLGVDESGDFYNGADDNGSGVVTLLEVAEAMIKTPQKPKRSILFLWVTSEEIGLFGSEYYSSNPVIPLEKTVTCINIDMNGRVYEPRDSVWKDSPKKVKDYDGLYTLTDDIWPGLKKINSEKCKELGLIPDYSLPERFLRSSDHYHFHNNGVPILNFATGYHYDYHKPTDEISRINFEKIKRVADLSYLVAYEVANKDVIEF